MRNVRSGSTANLGDLVDFVGGGTPRRDNPDFWAGPIAWASVKDLTGTDLESTAERITEEGLCNSATNLIGPGTVIVATRVGLGKVCINRIPVAINQDLKALIPRDGAVLARFLLYFLLSQAELIERSGVGATVKGVTIPFLQNLKLFLPSLTEQEEIVRALDAAEELRRLRVEADRRTADLIPAIFYETFGDPAVKSSHWPTASLDGVCSELYRYPTYYNIDYVEKGVPEVRGELLCDDGSISTDPASLRYISPETSSRFPRTQLSEGDLVMSVRGTIGKLGRVTHQISGANITANLIRISPEPETMDSLFLMAFLKSPVGLARLDGMSSSTTIHTIRASELKAMRVPVPPISLQREFSARVVEVRALEAQQAASRQRLDDLFQSILHRAFRGEL